MKDIYIVEGEKVRAIKYPRKSLKEKIEGMSGDIKLYAIIDNRPLEVDLRLQKVVPSDIRLVDEPHGEYKHLFQAIQDYTIIPLSNARIIAEIDMSVGDHLDKNYPTYKRIKHQREIADDARGKKKKDASRIEYIGSLSDWEDRCRESRNNKERELIENGILPNLYDWEEKPNKTK